MIESTSSLHYTRGRYCSLPSTGAKSSMPWSREVGEKFDLAEWCARRFSKFSCLCTTTSAPDRNGLLSLLEPVQVVQEAQKVQEFEVQKSSIQMQRGHDMTKSNSRVQMCQDCEEIDFKPWRFFASLWHHRVFSLFVRTRLFGLALPWQSPTESQTWRM